MATHAAGYDYTRTGKPDIAWDDQDAKVGLISGRLDIESQDTHRFPLAEFEAVIEALRGGDIVRVVVDVSS